MTPSIEEKAAHLKSQGCLFFMVVGVSDDPMWTWRPGYFAFKGPLSMRQPENGLFSTQEQAVENAWLRWGYNFGVL